MIGGLPHGPHACLLIDTPIKARIVGTEPTFKPFRSRSRSSIILASFLLKSLSDTLAALQAGIADVRG